MSKEERFEIFKGETKDWLIKDNEQSPQLLDCYLAYVRLNEFNQQLAELNAEVERLKMSESFEKEKKENALTLVEKLKAENEFLKENNTKVQAQGYGYFCDNAELRQQLKEKDEEIERLKFFKTRYYEMLKEKQDNTKQVCEKIRKLCKDCWEVKEYKSIAGITMQGIFNKKKFLQGVEKIEKGE